MPHLTPMNWVLSLLMIWLSMSMINSIQWWSTPLSLPFNQKPMSTTSASKWSW